MTDEILVKIYDSEIEKAAHDQTIGHILATKKELKVAVKDGFINLLEVQLQGKKRMKTQDMLNGIDLAKNAHML